MVQLVQPCAHYLYIASSREEGPSLVLSQSDPLFEMCSRSHLQVDPYPFPHRVLGSNGVILSEMVTEGPHPEEHI